MAKITLVSLVIFSGCWILTESIIRMPLKMVKVPKQTTMVPGPWETYRQRMTQMKTGKAVGLKANSKISLLDYSDVTYLAATDFGTPPQTFYVEFDTSSNLTWVPDVTCPNATCGSNKAKFNSSASSSYKTDGTKFDIEYYHANIEGFMGKDTFTLGGISVKDQSFGQATQMSKFMENLVANGVVGMGYSGPSSATNPPLPQNMFHQGLITQPLFSMFFENLNKSDVEVGGEIVFGGIDSTKYTGDITYIPVTQPGQWQVEIESISYYTNVYKPTSGKFKAIISSATPYITLPIAINDYIGYTMYGTYNPFVGLYEVNCSIKPSLYPPISFFINGHNMTLSPETYLVTLSKRCYLAFQGAGPMDVDIVLGSEWIKEYYSVFDFGQQRIGFAKSIHTT